MVIDAWMIIGGVTFLVAIVGGFLTRYRDLPWAKQLDRPQMAVF